MAILTYKFPKFYELTFKLPPALIWRKKSLNGLSSFFKSLDKEPKSILDVGCGIGIIIPIIRKFFKNANIVSIDTSREMIRYAKKVYGDMAEFRVENFFEHKGEYDLIVSFYSFCYFSLEEGLRKIKSLLREEGRAVIITCGVAPFSYFHRFYISKILREKEYLYNPCDFQKIINGCRWMLIDSVEGSYIISFEKRLFFSSF